MSKALIAAALMWASLLSVPSKAESIQSNIELVLAHLRSTGVCFNLDLDPYRTQACLEAADVPKLRVLVRFSAFTNGGEYVCSGNFLYHGIDEQHGAMEVSKVICPSEISDQFSGHDDRRDWIFLQAVAQLAMWLRLHEVHL